MTRDDAPEGLRARIERLDEPVLRALAERLVAQHRALVAELVDEDDVGPPSSASVAVQVDPPRLLVRAQYERSTSRWTQLVVTVPVEDERPTPSPRCSCDAEPCAHARAALDFALAFVTDARHTTELAPLVEALRVPAWRRVLESLDVALAGEGTGTEDRRLSWAIQSLGDRLMIEPWQETRGKNGRWTVKKRVTIEQLLAGTAGTSLVEDTRALAIIERELELLEHLGRMPRRATDLSQATTRRVIAALAGHPRVFSPQTADPKDEGLAVEIEAQHLVVAALEGEGGSVRLDVVLDQDRRPRPDLLDQLVRKIPGDVIIELDDQAGWCRAIHVPEDARRLLYGLRDRLVAFPPEARTELLRRLPDVEKHVPVLRDRSLEGLAVEAERDPFLRIGPSGAPAQLRVQVLVRPSAGLPACVPGEGPKRVFGVVEGGGLVFTDRALADEEARARALVESLPPLARLGPRVAYVYEVDGVAAVELVSLLEGRDELRVEWADGAWRPRVRRTDVADLRLEVRDQRDWFQVSGTIQVDETQVRLAALVDAVRRDQRYVEVDRDHWIELGDRLHAQLRRLDDLSLESSSKTMLDVSPALPLVAPDLVSSVGELRTSARWDELVRGLAAREEPPLPAELAGVLRNYQIEGHRWMARLAAWRFGACLADDMGLGKTLQAIAILSHRAGIGPALVVAPTSVAFNWARELARFAPSLRVVELGGIEPSARPAVSSKVGPGDVVIVGYGLLVREIERLEALTFSTFVLDEAQAVKNADTDRARAARRIDATWRLALTGTPVENHPGELWSLFRILAPGLLGSWERFKNRFILPMEMEDATERRRALAEILRPFVLRRTKSQVARELPPKTEVTIDVELSAAERRRYEEVRLSSIAELTGIADELPGERRRFIVLSAITRLRQLACHPRLVDAAWASSSAKLDTALQLLRELRAEGHRALVFSQFTGLLDLMEEALADAQIPWVRLDGETPARGREHRVDAFQRGQATAFLLSLKAGGTGLNLTAADYVLHLDPWWNPAAEDQATDRAHRIGQTRPVTVYRLVAKGTIEEQVLEVHDEKRALVDALLDGADTAAHLDTDALMTLIREGPR
ncbi:DEAD/DEAH box helicase [Myxococcota bacterium]|nr:DEAD/DEAH box helicase [Myxococcota bacterium]